MFPLGAIEATTTVIGNAMGAGDHELANKYLKVTASIALPAGWFLVGLAYVFRSEIALFYCAPTEES